MSEETDHVGANVQSLKSWAKTLKDHLPWLGDSIYMAWPFIFYYSTVAIPEGASYLGLSVSFGLSSLAFSVALVVLAACRSRTRKTAVGGRPLYVAGAFVALGLLICFASSLAPEAATTALLAVAGIVTGASSSYIVLHYGMLYSQLENKEIAVLFPLNYLLAALLYFILDALPVLPARVILLVLLFVPLPSLNSRLEQPEVPKNAASMTLKSTLSPIATLLVSVLVFGLVFGYQRGYMTNGLTENAASSSNAYFVAMAVGALALSLVYGLWQKSINPTVAYRGAAIVMAVGLLCLAYMPNYGNVVGSIFIAVSYLAFDLSVLIGLSEYIRQSRTSSLVVFSYGYASSHLGMAVGMLIGLAANMLGGASNQSAQAITAIVELLILVVAMCTFPGKEAAPAQTSGAGPGEGADGTVGTAGADGAGAGANAAPETDASADTSPTGASPRPRAAACEKLSSDFGLSNREREVLALMLEGRNMPYIEKELCISENTVKTHKRHIYEKLSVHSQQELLDMADAIEGRGQGAPESH